MGEGARMASVVSSRMQHLQLELSQEFKKHSGEQLGMKYKIFIHQSIDCGIARFGLVGFLENTLFMNLQVSILGIQRFLTGKTDWQTLFSLMMTYLVAVWKISDAVQLLLCLWNPIFDRERYRRDIKLSHVII